MSRANISRAAMGRLPLYLNYIKSEDLGEYISSTKIAKALELGEVQVRKDLNLVCSDGRPKIGYNRNVLIASIEDALRINDIQKAVLIGAGKLGMALLEYSGFREYGADIVAGFDTDPQKIGELPDGKRVYPLSSLKVYCKENSIHIGVLTVPAENAQTACDLMTQCGIDVIWVFSRGKLKVPSGVTVRKENLALGLAHLIASSEED